MDHWLVIGADPIDRPESMASGYTCINADNPANQDGQLKKVAIFMDIAGVNFQVGIFHLVGANTFSTRSHCNLGNVPLGYSEHDVDLEVKVGDYIGCHYTVGKIDRSRTGAGYWQKSGDQIPCTAQIFTPYTPRAMSLYGWTEAPPITYSRFTIQDIAYTPNCQTVTVVTHTDVPCHKYLRFTDKSPRKHPRTLLRRGLLTQYDLRQCFVAYYDIEQEEAGDTLEHTFILENLMFCHGYFFYFWAESTGLVMIYTSAIFAFRYPLGLPPYLTCERQELTDGSYHYAQYWNACSQTFRVTHDYKVDHLSLILNQFSTERRGPYTVKITRDIPPCYAEPILAQDYGSSLALPAPGTKSWKSWWGIKPILEVGKTYRIVVHTLPGWEYWNGEEWIEWEAGAALQWYLSASNNPYALGSAYYGCNISARSGPWQIITDVDATFRLYQLCPSLPS